MEGGTLNETSSRTASASTRLLSYILSYEELTAAKSARFRLDGLEPRITLGRAFDDGPVGVRSPSELRVPDRWLSSSHASLEGDRLRDLGSRNGTFVNGEPIREARLVDGDLIEVGHSIFCYRVVAADAAATLDAIDKKGLRLGPTPTFCPEVALLLADLSRIAPSTEAVLLLAESGAGKEVAAETVHRLSGRAGAYRVIDCGAVPETLFESTFFGHRRGAFTGAVEARTGEIERAHGGTLFLDEIGNLAVTSQAKLLRVIESGEVLPIGAAQPLAVEVRWVAATNRDLFGDPGSFRHDLLRRISGYVGRVPPLRRRREDLGALTAHLLRDAGCEKASISVAAARRLFSGEFPGNVRQLRAALRSAWRLAGERPIDLAQLPAPETEAPATEAPPRREGAPSAGDLERVLAATGGNVVRAAEELGTHARQIYRWIEKHGIDLQKFRG